MFMFKLPILFVIHLPVCELSVFILSKLHNWFAPVGILTFPESSLKNQKPQTGPISQFYVEDPISQYHRDSHNSFLSGLP